MTPRRRSKHLHNALYNSLNDFVRWDWNKVGNVGFHLLYAYFDQHGKLQRKQLTAGAFKDKASFMFSTKEKGRYDTFCDRNLLPNPVQPSNTNRPRLEPWDDLWNRPTAVQVLKDFLSELWVSAYGSPETAEEILENLAAEPARYLPALWQDSGIADIDSISLAVLQPLYTRLLDAQDGPDALSFQPQDDQPEQPSGASTPARASSPLHHVVFKSPSKKLHERVQDGSRLTTPPSPSTKLRGDDLDSTRTAPGEESGTQVVAVFENTAQVGQAAAIEGDMEMLPMVLVEAIADDNQALTTTAEEGTVPEVTQVSETSALPNLASETSGQVAETADSAAAPDLEALAPEVSAQTQQGLPPDENVAADNISSLGGEAPHTSRKRTRGSRQVVEEPEPPVQGKRARVMTKRAIEGALQEPRPRKTLQTKCAPGAQPPSSESAKTKKKQKQKTGKRRG
ncbi:hypothetical protein C8Q76DRAFT_788521 [Earliella scabrosa]|nr:hypothetical protein C8Q76DRAFT_788521 [Earliella scabrosa]